MVLNQQNQYRKWFKIISLFSYIIKLALIVERVCLYKFSIELTEILKGECRTRPKSTLKTMRPISDAASLGRVRSIPSCYSPSHGSNYLTDWRDWWDGVTAAAAAAEEEEGEGVGEMRKKIFLCTRPQGLVMRQQWSRCASPTLSPSIQGIASHAHRMNHHHPCKSSLSLPPSLSILLLAEKRRVAVPCVTDRYHLIDCI